MYCCFILSLQMKLYENEQEDKAASEMTHSEQYNILFKISPNSFGLQQATVS